MLTWVRKGEECTQVENEEIKKLCLKIGSALSKYQFKTKILILLIIQVISMEIK